MQIKKKNELRKLSELKALCMKLKMTQKKNEGNDVIKSCSLQFVW